MAWNNQNIQCCNFPGGPRFSLGHSLSSPLFLGSDPVGPRGTTWAQTLRAAPRDRRQSEKVRHLRCSALQQGARKPSPLSHSGWWFCLRMEDAWRSDSRWGSQTIYTFLLKTIPPPKKIFSKNISLDGNRKHYWTTDFFFFHPCQPPCNISLVFPTEEGIMRKEIITTCDQLVWKCGCALCCVCQYTNLHPM